jgi:hypothetical protein
MRELTPMSRQLQKNGSSTLKKLLILNGLRSWLRIGTGFAFSFIRVNYAFCLCLVMSGCLVTDEITFDTEENVPPVILDVQSSNTRIGIGDIVYFDVESPGTIEFEFRVRDENIGHPLEYRRKILVPGSGTFVPNEDTKDRIIPPSYEPIRYYKDTIGNDAFERDSCYRIEVAMSLDFEYASSDLYRWNVPVEKDDVSETNWYIVTGESAGCPKVKAHE